MAVMRLKRPGASNVHESFSDVALLMLATFVFLLVIILVTSRIQEKVEAPRLRQQVEQLQGEVAGLEKERERLNHEMDRMVAVSSEDQVEEVLAAVGLDSSTGRHDFDLFIEGLKEIPGNSIHLVIDATGSMHGAATFLIPMLRVITIRSGKHLAAVTWFSDGRAETYTGSMGEMFDQFMIGAPFFGASETIGDAFFQVAQQSPPPGAYILLGDEPSDDRIDYNGIPSPVFPIAIGRSNPDTNWEYGNLADKSGGRLLKLSFQ